MAWLPCGETDEVRRCIVTMFALGGGTLIANPSSRGVYVAHWRFAAGVGHWRSTIGRHITPSIQDRTLRLKNSAVVAACYKLVALPFICPSEQPIPVADATRRCRPLPPSWPHTQGAVSRAIGTPSTYIAPRATADSPGGPYEGYRLRLREPTGSQRAAEQAGFAAADQVSVGLIIARCAEGIAGHSSTRAAHCCSPAPCPQNRTSQAENSSREERNDASPQQPPCRQHWRGGRRRRAGHRRHRRRMRHRQEGRDCGRW